MSKHFYSEPYWCSSDGLRLWQIRALHQIKGYLFFEGCPNPYFYVSDMKDDSVISSRLEWNFVDKNNLNRSVVVKLQGRELFLYSSHYSNSSRIGTDRLPFYSDCLEGTDFESYKTLLTGLDAVKKILKENIILDPVEKQRTTIQHYFDRVILGKHHNDSVYDTKIWQLRTMYTLLTYLGKLEHGLPWLNSHIEDEMNDVMRKDFVTTHMSWNYSTDDGSKHYIELEIVGVNLTFYIAVRPVGSNLLTSEFFSYTDVLEDEDDETYVNAFVGLDAVKAYLENNAPFISQEQKEKETMSLFTHLI